MAECTAALQHYHSCAHTTVKLSSSSSELSPRTAVLVGFGVYGMPHSVCAVCTL